MLTAKHFAIAVPKIIFLTIKFKIIFPVNFNKMIFNGLCALVNFPIYSTPTHSTPASHGVR